ncbi:MAG: apolipoprotein N-acyltransferase [Desulfovibrio sp.]|nr:apolipoprotein N-acyltransferase [Desulfovibrio sp.]
MPLAEYSRGFGSGKKPGAAERYASLPAMFLGTLLCVLGYWLGFPNDTLRPPGAVLLFPLGTLVICLNAATTLQAVFWACLAGSVAAFPPIHWVGLPTLRHGGGMAQWAWLFPLLAAFGHGLYLALYVLLVRRARARHGAVAFALFAGILWMAMEWAKSSWCKFPLLTLTAGLAPWPVFIQACALMGSQALAGTYVSCLALLAVSRARLAAFALPASILAMVLMYGVWALNSPLPDVPSVSVTCVQGMMPVDMVWKEEKQLAAVARMRDLTREALLLGPSDFVLWSETILPMFFDLPTPMTDMVRAVAGDGEVNLMFGALSRAVVDGRILPRNRVFLVGQDGQVRAFYDKQQLVPFGEYMPKWFRGLPRFISGSSDVEPGPNNAPLSCGKARVGVLICFESMFPALALERVAQGANLLVNLSNDLWFEGSTEPQLLLEHTSLRAVEQGRFLVRATNSGFTAVIDWRGRIVESILPNKVASVRFAHVSLLEDPTLFQRIGRMFVPGALFLAVIWSFGLVLFHRKRF